MLTIQYGSLGKPLKIGDLLLFCYILDNKQRVITKDSFQKALGYDGKSDTWLKELLTAIIRFAPVLHSELLFALNNPLEAKNTTNEAEEIITELLDSRILAKCCTELINAKEDGFLNVNQLKFAKSAAIVLEITKNTSIENLIDEVTGFVWYKEKTIENVIQKLLYHQNDDAYKWIHTIPVSFIENILFLNNLDWKPIFEKPSTLGRILNELIFTRIKNETLNDLRTSKPKRTYKRKNNKIQDSENLELKKYIIALESLIIASEKNWSIFIQLLNKAYPKQKNRPTINFTIDENSTNKIQSIFNEKLIKSISKR